MSNVISKGQEGNLHAPYNRVCADNELWPGVPLVISNVVMGLKPNPLLPFGEESVVAGLSFPILHYYTEAKRRFQCSALEAREEVDNWS